MNRKRIRRLGQKLAICGVALLTIVASGLTGIQHGIVTDASTVVTAGDFRLTAENLWEDSKGNPGDTDFTLGKNYVKLKWDSVSGANRNRLHQRAQNTDGSWPSEWSSIAANYGKMIKVLNVYPDIAGSDKLKSWMEGTGTGELNFINTADNNKPFIEVDPVKLTDYNANPAQYLGEGTTSNPYKYDVIMFGSWDRNNSLDISAAAYTATDAFGATGRGVLFGHDTIATGVIIPHPQFARFAERIGIESTITTPSYARLQGSTKVKLINNGPLMQFPFPMQIGQEFTIPSAHNINLSDMLVGTTWMEFVPTFSHLSNVPNSGGSLATASQIYKQTTTNGKTYQAAWYLKTNGNYGMIQTGHSGGDSNLTERQIIANTIYNLSQVSNDTSADAREVSDNIAPDLTKADVTGGSLDNLSLTLSSKDNGKNYQWYVESTMNDTSTKKSDTAEEEVTSDLAGFIYVADNTADTDPKVERDSYGRVTNITQTVTRPEGTAANSERQVSITGINGRSNQYLHIIAVDRAGNVSKASHINLSEIVNQYTFTYEIERTADVAQPVDVKLASTIDSTIRAVEVQFPKTYNLSALTLPTGWGKSPVMDINSSTQSVMFTISNTGSNTNASIVTFIQSLRFAINDPKNDAKNIQIFLSERIMTMWEDHPDGKIHYYEFIESNKKNWLSAYNEAKGKKYRGLTGYLATLTSLEEHDFLFNKIATMSGWIGGTRMVKESDKTKINDEASISTNIADFNYTDLTQAKEWYWADGPEAGLVFFDKPTFSEGGKAPAGVYQGFNNPASGGPLDEPNNSASGNKEYVIEFAQGGYTKYWNDLRYDYNMTMTNRPQGYYVEYSVYGDQEEDPSTEKGTIGWRAQVPQKISLKAYDEDGNALDGTNGRPNANLLFDQKLRIGQLKQLTSTAKSGVVDVAQVKIPLGISMYDFQKLTEGSAQGGTQLAGNTNQAGKDYIYQYIVGAAYQEGRLEYENRRVTAHIRQVVTGSNANVVSPSNGYVTLYSRSTASGANVQEFSLAASGTQKETDLTQTFTAAAIRSQLTEPFYTLRVVLPEYYKSAGYVVTYAAPTAAAPHRVAAATATTPVVDIRDHPEFWLTIYITPSESEPAFYGWNYSPNNNKAYTVTRP